MPTPLTLTAADSPPLVLTVPTRWADVPMGRFVDLLAPQPEETRLPAEILCGVDAGTLGPLALADVAYLGNLLAFSLDPGDVLALRPTPGLPDIGSLPYGILLEAQQHIEDNPDRPALAYAPYILALYRVQLAYGKYDQARVAAAHAAILAAPVTEVYADAAFFLSQSKQWCSGISPTPTTRPSSTTKNTKRARKSSASGSGRFSTWMRRLAAPS